MRIAIYDLSGRIVEPVFDGWMEVGSQQVAFTAEGMPSGTYLYEVQTETELATGMMTIAK